MDSSEEEEEGGSRRLPSNADLAKAEELGGPWIEGGQKGPNPVPGFQCPGGHQSIGPGVTVFLTMTFRAGYTYQLSDFATDTPIQATVTVP